MQICIFYRYTIRSIAMVKSPVNNDKLPAPQLATHDGYVVVRDDLIPGGSKRRVLTTLLENLDADEFVYPSTAYGYGPLALAYAAQDLGKKAVLFYPDRLPKNWTPLMHEAHSLGAEIKLVKMGRMTVLKARARTYCENNQRAHLMSLGFDGPDFHDAFKKVVSNVANQLPRPPKEVWCAAGTGSLTRVLQDVWPDADHHAVLVAGKSIDVGKAAPHIAKLAFEKATKNLPPFPSAKNYDAKAWNEMKKRGRPGALFWNVGA